MREATRQVDWLLEGDPAIRYQTLRDLVKASPEAIQRERHRMLSEGWARRFLDLQEEEGSWSHALYSPKWTSTFYTLLVLTRCGLPRTPQTDRACRLLVEKGFYAKDGGVKYWKTWTHSECCVTGMLVSMLCHFRYDDDRVHRMVEFLLSEQMPDRGWNCDRPKGAHHSSFHTTLSVLEGLQEYAWAFPSSGALAAVRARQEEGIEFLLQHHLYKSDTSWRPVHPDMMRLSFPPRWHFDVLRCLDFFQRCNVPQDPRMADAIELLLSKRTPEGLWTLEKRYPAKEFFRMETVGRPSRWNTLRALRVLKWWA